MIHFWDYTSFQHKSTLTGHTFPINEIAFAPDGQFSQSVGGGESGAVWW